MPIPYNQKIVDNSYAGLPIGAVDTMKYDPTRLEFMAEEFRIAKEQMVALRDEMLRQAKYIVNNKLWDSVGGYGFMRNKFLPVYKEYNSIIISLQNRERTLRNVAIVYRGGSQKVSQRVDNLPAGASER